MAFVAVKGEVNRVFYNGLGVSVKESFTRRDGSEGAAYFTAWFDQDPGLAEGASGEFSGVLSVKLSEYEKDGERVTGYDVNINNAKFKPSERDSFGSDEPF